MICILCLINAVSYMSTLNIENDAGLSVSNEQGSDPGNTKAEPGSSGGLSE